MTFYLPSTHQHQTLLFKNSFKSCRSLCFLLLLRPGQWSWTQYWRRGKKELKRSQRKGILPEIAGPLNSFDSSIPGKVAPSMCWNRITGISPPPTAWGGSKQCGRAAGKERIHVHCSGDHWPSLGQTALVRILFCARKNMNRLNQISPP